MANPQGEIYTGLQICTHVDRWQAWLSEFSDEYIPQGYFPCTVCCFWTPFNVPSKIWLVMKACLTDVWLCTQRHGAHLTTTRLGNTLSRHCRDWNCKVLECLGFVSRLCVYSFRFDRILSWAPFPGSVQTRHASVRKNLTRCKYLLGFEVWNTEDSTFRAIFSFVLDGCQKRM